MKKDVLQKHIVFFGIFHLFFLIILGFIINRYIQEMGIAIFIICLSSSFLFVLYYVWYRIKSSEYIEDYKKTAQLNRILYELIHTCSQLTTREALYKEILKRSIQAISNASKGCILLLEDDNVLKYQAVYGYDEEALKQTYLLLEQSFLYLESKGKIEHTVVINDPFEYDKKKVKTENMKKILEASPFQIRTTLSTPIIINNKLHGMINVDSELKNAYNKQDIEAIEIFAYEVVNVIKLYDSLERNQFLLNRDVLTGIYNRRYFNNVMLNILYNGNKNDCFFLISFDLNNLKKANDQYGHECGDKMLVLFANGVKHYIKDDDLFARYGGDEFLLLLNVQSLDFVEAFIKNIKKFFSDNPLKFQGKNLYVSFSYGISFFPDDGKSINALIKQADNNMYMNKRNYHLLVKEQYEWLEGEQSET